MMKGQISFEFIVIVFIILSILLALFATTTRTQMVTQDNELQRRTMDICQELAERINKAIYFGSGFRYEIKVPDNIYGVDYNILFINNKTVVCSTNTFSIVKIFIETKIQNETSQLPFYMRKGKLTILNENGIVTIK